MNLIVLSLGGNNGYDKLGMIIDIVGFVEGVAANRGDNCPMQIGRFRAAIKRIFYVQRR